MKIGIADPQARVRFGLRILLDQQPGWTVIGEAADSHELLLFLRRKCPDLVLLDWDLPDLPAETLLQKLHAQCPALRVISMNEKQELRQAALQAGADGFAYKADPPEKLLALIRGLEARMDENPRPETSRPSSSEH